MCHGVVITRSDISRELKGTPGARSHIEHIDIVAAIFTLKTTVEDDFGIRLDRSGVVRDFARSFSGRLDQLPLNSVERIFLQHVNLGQVDAPHGLDSALLKVTSSMDVEVLIRSILSDERAVV